MQASQTAASVIAPHANIARVLVKKTERRLYLLDPQGYAVRSYPVMLGPNPAGHKQQEGDGKTPEGKYVIDTRNENSDYTLSLRISYPNDSDKKRARQAGVSPGGDIFIHGKPSGKSWMWWKYKESQNWTQGCIAVSNDAIQDIWNLVSDGTEIIIEP